MKQYVYFAVFGAVYLLLTRILDAHDLAEVALLVAMVAVLQSFIFYGKK